MDRSSLDILYRSKPRRAFQRALGDFDADSCAFLVKHAGELEAAEALGVLLRTRDIGFAETSGTPVVNRLVELLSADPTGLLLQTLQTAKDIDPEVWAEMTMQLQGRLKNWQWYRFVDKVRGGPVFNRLNVAPRLDPSCFVSSFEQDRPEPAVVGLLHRRFDDQYAITYERSLSSETRDAQHRHMPPIARQTFFPPGPGRISAGEIFAASKLAVEANELAFAIAVKGFRHEPNNPLWSTYLGEQLQTGKAWKQHGHAVVEVCLMHQGVPPTLTNAALDVVAHDGADEKEHERAVLAAMHDVAGTVFLRHIEVAIRSGAWDTVGKLLVALTSLDPGSFVAGPIHRLSKLREMPSEIADLIGVCETLFKRSSGRNPTVESFREAFFDLRGGVL